MSAQSEKARQFAALHQASGGFILPNPWDAGSARIMANSGFKALATSSAAHANTLGRGDYKISLDEALQHCRLIASATDLPVTADLENGFAHRPDQVADTVLMASETGIVGCSIEDATQDPHSPLYPLELAVERVRLAVVASQRLRFPFLITARTDALIHGIEDMGEVVRRPTAFEKAGAHVLYAPGVRTLDQARQICASVKRPANVMAHPDLSAPDLIAAGVKRVSLGPWLARAAIQGLLTAIAEVNEHGTFRFAASCPTGQTVAKLMQ